MNLHTLKPNHKRTTKVRVGRGGKRGTTSGRGQKGQKSRSGHKMRPAFRDLLIRIPKLRGFRNKTKSEKPAVFNLETLNNMQASIVNLEALKSEGYVGNKFKGVVKVLGTGELTRRVDVVGLRVSKSARAKIAKAGGKVS